MEAPIRIELMNNGFAIRSLSHLGTAPEPQNRQSRRHSTMRSHGRQQELGQARGFNALSNVDDGGNWTCVDLVDLVVHLFSAESRAFYDLDNLWGDARKVIWKE